MSFKYTEIGEALPEGVQVRYEVTVTGPHPDDHIGSVDRHGVTDWRWTGDPVGKSHRTRIAAAGSLLDTNLATKMDAAVANLGVVAAATMASGDPANAVGIVTDEGNVIILSHDHPPQPPLPQQPQVDVTELAGVPSGFEAFDGAVVPTHTAPTDDISDTEGDAFAQYEDPTPRVEPQPVTEQVGLPAEWATTTPAPIGAVMADALIYGLNHGEPEADPVTPQNVPPTAPGQHGDSTVITARVINGVITIDCTSCADLVVGTRNQGFAVDTFSEHIGLLLKAQRQAVVAARADTWP